MSRTWLLATLPGLAVSACLLVVTIGHLVRSGRRSLLLRAPLVPEQD